MEEDHVADDTPHAFAERGDHVALELAYNTGMRLDENVWGERCADGGLVEGIVDAFIDVGHSQSGNCLNVPRPTSTDNDTDLWVQCLKKVVYTWEGDAALTRVPLVQPGDTVVVLKPVGVQSSARLLFVHRFVTGVSERNRFILHVDKELYGFPSLDRYIHATQIHRYCTPLNSDDAYMQDVERVEFLCAYSLSRAASMKEVPPVLGTLELSEDAHDRSGEAYGVYRVLLYWDKFELHKGNGAEAEGIYMVPLSVNADVRKDASTPRVLALLPPGADPLPPMRALMRSAIRGATEGRVCIDADGVKRRIFIDVVAVISDTPGLNAALDVLGHGNGGACCHKCTFNAKADSLVNGFAGKTDTWARLSTRRSARRHRCVRAMKTNLTVMRDIGVVAEPSGLQLVLHEWPETQLDQRVKDHPIERNSTNHFIARR